MKYDYILEKISSAEFSTHPFYHIEIDRLFEENDFDEIIGNVDIKIPKAKDDTDLLNLLFNAGYRIIEFPGCTQDYREYIDWHRKKEISKKTNTSCEGFGVVLRQTSPKSQVIRNLIDFLESEKFVNCISKKFGLLASDCKYDCGIQKYLDGYEISPHPDIRRKALTYMVNINPNMNSHLEDHHTHYLTFKKEYEYVNRYWEGNVNVDTCWIPWEWCNIEKSQVKNNSLVIFAPGADTVHGVKTSYDHLVNQRTQLYGNLWFKENPASHTDTKWEQLQIDVRSKTSLKEKIMGSARQKLPIDIKRFLRDKQKNISLKTHSGRKY